MDFGEKMFKLKIEADISHFVFLAHAGSALKIISAYWVYAKKVFTHAEHALKSVYAC
jgi:hypothetical protein